MSANSRKCVNCHQLLSTDDPRARYCSRKCRQAAYQRRMAAGQRIRPAPTAEPATCHWCNRSFWTTSKAARYCSTSCRVSYHRFTHQWLEDTPDVLPALYWYYAANGLEPHHVQRALAAVPGKRAHRLIRYFQAHILPALPAPQKTPPALIANSRATWPAADRATSTPIVPREAPIA